MKQFFSKLLIGVFGVSLFATPVAAQSIQILLEDDQLLKMGRTALHAGDLERAEAYYESALDRGNLSRLELIAVHDGLCVVYMYAGKFDEALTQCKASIDLQPNRWEALNNLGTVYIVKGDYPKAISTIEKGLGMKPKSRILNFNMGIAQNRLQGINSNEDIQLFEGDLDDDQMSGRRTGPASK